MSEPRRRRRPQPVQPPVQAEESPRRRRRAQPFAKARGRRLLRALGGFLALALAMAKRLALAVGRGMQAACAWAAGAAQRAQQRMDDAVDPHMSPAQRRRLHQARSRRLMAAGLACVAVFCAVQMGAILLRTARTKRLARELSAVHAQTAQSRQDEAMAAPEASAMPDTSAAPETSAMLEAAAKNEATAAPEASAMPAPSPAQKDAVRTTVYHDLGGTPLAEMAALRKQNRDLVGWLSIEGVIDLPVVYRDNRYYLTRDFNREKSAAGTIFLDEHHPMGERAQNLLLHGHNMKDGTMFGRLAQYEKSIDYLKANPFIELSTLWHAERYAIFAVLDVSLDVKSDRFLDFYSYPTFASDAQFEAYVRKLQLRSRYAIPMDVAPTDALLTLSTCLGDDRLVIVARRQRPNESKSDLRRTIGMATRQ